MKFNGMGALGGLVSLLLLTLSCTQKAKVEAPNPPSCDDSQALYKTCADQMPAFLEAVEKAKAENKILLITFGADWCPWCQSLNKLFESEEFKKALTKKKGKQKSLADRLVFYKVGVSHKVNNERQRVLSGFEIFDRIAHETGSGEQKINGIPYLVFYNPSKNQAVFRPSGNLEKSGGGVAHDQQKVLKAIEEAVKRWK